MWNFSKLVKKVGMPEKLWVSDQITENVSQIKLKSRYLAKHNRWKGDIQLQTFYGSVIHEFDKKNVKIY